MVNDERNENGIMKQRMVTKLALAELTEGITPIVYAIGIAMAYYGSNGHILGNVKNSYWGYNAIEDVGYLFQIMLLLFGADTFSVLVNFVMLSTLTNVDLFREFCRIMDRYWYFIAIEFAMNMDSTGEFNWITNDGRISLINGSTDLSYDEKIMLLNQTIF